MDKEFSDGSQFQINVNGNVYNVTAYCNESHCTRFKIETNCNYLFTLCTDEEGYWKTEKDVTIMDESLVEEIGRAIEEHDVA
jgi:hypothetical protein